MRTTIFPMNSMQLRPSFWGVDRDLKGILEDMESAWDGKHVKSYLTNIHETDQLYMLTLDIPGVNKSNLDIEIEENHIRVEGLRRHQTIKNEEQTKDKISRLVAIPKDVDRDKIQAHTEDGVLYLALPKLEKTKPKKINVTSGKRDTLWSNFLGENKENLSSHKV